MTIEPDFEFMREADQKFLVRIYNSIFSWLTLSISLNSRCSNKTRNIRREPFPDIVAWWKSVEEVFALTTSEIDKKVEQINYLKQFSGELCKNYFTRFDDKAIEIKELGRNLDDVYLGDRCIRGMIPNNRSQANQFLIASRLKSTMVNVWDICKYIDEMNEDNNAKKEEIRALAVSNSEHIGNNSISKYGPARDN